MCNTRGLLGPRLQWLQTGLDRRDGSGDFAATDANRAEVLRVADQFGMSIVGLVELVERKPRLTERYASLLRFMRSLTDQEAALSDTSAVTD